MGPTAIIHVDMDAFYASVAQRDDPALRGKPVIVGGHPTRGVVLAASYEVRPFGVKSAIPMSRAVQLAPKAVVVAPDFEAYEDASLRVFEIFHRYTPLVEPLSLDEAFLDVTASVGLFGPPARIASALRKAIADEVHLPASAGIAPVKFVAKVASDVAKPNGQLEVLPGQVRAFLAPLPASRLWGVGPKTDELLRAKGIRTIGDVASRTVESLERELGPGGRHLWELSQGLDDRAVIPDHEAKSIGSEDTFDEDLEGEEALAPHVHAQALRVGRRLRRSNKKAHVVQLKVKFADFELVTRQRRLDSPTDDGQELYRAARELFAKVDLARAVRLTGVSAQLFAAEEPQLALFAEEPKPADRLNAALDQIAAKFGSAAVTTADVAGPSRGRGRDR